MFQKLDFINKIYELLMTVLSLNENGHVRGTGRMVEDDVKIKIKIKMEGEREI